VRRVAISGDHQRGLLLLLLPSIHALNPTLFR
jgi:hypothetical protein